MGGQGSGNKQARGQKGNKGGGRSSLFGQPMTKQIAVKLNAKQLVWLEEKAKQNGRKPSALVRDFVEEKRQHDEAATLGAALDTIDAIFSVLGV